VAAAADVAPPGSASATAAQVSSLAGISSTGATANSSAAEARATVLSVGGQSLPGTGGSTSGEGESGGALVDTGDKAPARVQVAPWHTAAHGSKSAARRHSQASAALARVEVPSVAKAAVLASDAEAEHRSDQSTSKGISDAADVSLGDSLRLVLLHSEVGSTGKGHSYLVGINGTEIGTDDQLGRSCALDAGVASLSCLTASGGVANGVTSGAAEVLGVKTALGLNPVDAFSTSASFGNGTPSILGAIGSTLPTTETARSVTPVAAPARAATGLPRTGVAIVSLAASALAALLSGLVLRLFGRRRAVA
jgi:hypothetical protein